MIIVSSKPKSNKFNENKWKSRKAHSSSTVIYLHLHKMWGSRGLVMYGLQAGLVGGLHIEQESSCQANRSSESAILLVWSETEQWVLTVYSREVFVPSAFPKFSVEQLILWQRRLNKTRRSNTADKLQELRPIWLCIPAKFSIVNTCCCWSMAPVHMFTKVEFETENLHVILPPLQACPIIVAIPLEWIDFCLFECWCDQAFNTTAHTDKPLVNMYVMNRKWIQTCPLCNEQQLCSRIHPFFITV